MAKMIMSRHVRLFCLFQPCSVAFFLSRISYVIRLSIPTSCFIFCSLGEKVSHTDFPSRRRSADQPHAHHLCVQPAYRNTSVACLPWYEICGWLDSSSYFLWTPLAMIKPLGHMNHVSAAHAFPGCFHSSASHCTLHRLTPLSPFFHVPYSPSSIPTPLSQSIIWILWLSVPRCIATRFRFVDVEASRCLICPFFFYPFFFFRWKAALDIIILSSVGKVSPFPYFSSPYPIITLT